MYLPVRREDFHFPLVSQFDKLFNDFFNESNSQAIKAHAGYPKLNIFESNNQLVIKAGVPGLKSENLEVEFIPYGTETSNSSQLASLGNPFGIDDRIHSILILSGKMSEEHTPSESGYHLRELRSSAFKREVWLPPHIKEEPQAVLKDGVLTLTWDLPVEVEPEKKFIEIKTE